MHHRNNNTATVVHMLHTDHGVKYSLFKSPDRRNIYLKHFCFFFVFVYVNSSGRSRKIYLYLIIKNMPPHTRACPNAVFTAHRPRCKMFPFKTADRCKIYLRHCFFILFFYVNSNNTSRKIYLF